MKKISFEYHLKSYDTVSFKGIGYYEEENGKIIYNEKDNTKVVLDLNNLILKRDNSTLSLTLDFKKKQGCILVKELNNSIDLELKVNDITIEKDSFLVEYITNKEEYIYDIKWSIGGE